MQPASPAPPAINPAEMPRLDPDSLAVVPVRFEPTGGQGPIYPTKGESTAKGAVGGVGKGLLGVLDMHANDPLSLTIALIIFVPVGTVVGAAEGYAHGASREEIKLSKQNWQKAMSSLRIQERLGDKLMAELRKKQVSPQLSLRVDVGPTTPEEKPTYRDLNEQTVLEAGVVRIDFMPSNVDKKEKFLQLAVTVHARVIDPSRQLVLDGMTHVYHSPVHTVSDWLRDDAMAFTQALDDAIGESARAIVTEFFRIYYPPASSEPADSHQSGVPYFELRPLYPRVDRWPWISITQVDSLRPTFRWESFPRSFDLASSNGRARQFTHVSYDLALYSVNVNTIPGEPSHTQFALGHLVHYVTGLTEPYYELEESLIPCKRYAWTIRAHFFLNGHPRWTEWSDIERYIPPWMGRRNLDQSPRPYFLQFRAPSVEAGKQCKETN